MRYGRGPLFQAARQDSWGKLRWRTIWAPAAVFVLGSLASGAVYYQFAGVVAAKDENRFENIVQRQTDSIRERFETYIAMLRAGAGYVDTTTQLKASEFHQFVTRLQLQERYPGIQGLGVTQRVSGGALPAFVDSQRASGRQDFKVWPDEPRAEYHAITHLEPMDRRNQAAIGYDMFTEPVRREAMERARDSGQPTASGPVTLVQEIDEIKQAGFLIYVPVYSGGGVPDTAEARRDLLRGYVYAPFRVNDLFRGIFGSEEEPRVAFALYDGAQALPESRVYQSSSLPIKRGRFFHTAELDVAGRKWTIEFLPTPAFSETSTGSTLPIVPLGGAILTLLLTGIAFQQVRVRETNLHADAVRRHAEAEMRLHSHILANMTEGVSLSDEAGQILYTNAAEDQMFGYERGELVGKHVSVQNAYAAEENGKRVAEVIEQLKEKGAWSGEWQNRRKDGSEFYTHANITAVSRDGRQYWVCVQHDITAERQARMLAEQANREKDELLIRERAARSEAERLNRMKDEFLATLSHELRTPLNAILGWVQILSRRTLEKEVREGVSVIERNARAQTRLIEDLLDMSRIISGKIRLDVQRVELSSVIQAAIDSIRPAADAKSIRLSVTLDPLAGPVKGDPARLQQMVWNLLSNAVKFTPSGGRVQAALERVNSHLEISVTDSGQGIKPDFLPHVFDRFVQADSSTTRRHGGLGLGLSIVKQLVELHGGEVRAKSPGEGQGATFILSLPLMAIRDVEPWSGERTHPVQEKTPVDASSVPTLSGVRVLVVDDERDSRDLVKRLLEDHDAQVFDAASAASAIDLLSRETPTVIVSDIGMPDVDGFQLIREIRAMNNAVSAIPAIALTAFARSEDRTRAFLAGYQIHVAKPVESAELIAAVAALAGRT